MEYALRKVQGYGEKGTEVWGRVQGYGEKGTEVWGRVQGYGADGLRTKVKFFYLTYFTFGFTLPVSTLIL